jgi:hypothetical protein
MVPLELIGYEVVRFATQSVDFYCEGCLHKETGWRPSDPEVYPVYSNHPRVFVHMCGACGRHFDRCVSLYRSHILTPTGRLTESGLTKVASYASLDEAFVDVRHRFEAEPAYAYKLFNNDGKCIYERG